MIRPLRQRHRRMVAVIGVLLPVAFATGIAARKPAPIVTTLPAALGTTTHSIETIEWQSGAFTKSPVKVGWLRATAGAGLSSVVFSAPKDFVKPDLIVYWVPGSPTLADGLPDDARLLGSFHSSVELPSQATSVTGVLVLYSLADQEVVDVSTPFTLRKP
jgi:ABC-type nitrate/sulfonate/bicarbonate transport system substrate-binding protein